MGSSREWSEKDGDGMGGGAADCGRARDKGEDEGMGAKDGVRLAREDDDSTRVELLAVEGRRKPSPT